MSSANTKQIGGSHYRGTPLQHWDFVLSALGNSYLEGQITKYVVRHRRKDGETDLQKALHYTEKLLEAQKAGFVQPVTRRFPFDFKKFCQQIGLDEEEAHVCFVVSQWSSRADLKAVRELIKSLLLRYAPSKEVVDPISEVEAADEKDSLRTYVNPDQNLNGS